MRGFLRRVGYGFVHFIQLLFNFIWLLLAILYELYDRIKRAIKGLPSTRWLLSEITLAEKEVVRLAIEANEMRVSGGESIEHSELGEAEIEAIRWKLKLPLIKYDIEDVYNRLPFGYVPDYWALAEKVWIFRDEEPPKEVRASEEIPDALPAVEIPSWAYTAMESLYEAHVRATLGQTEEGLRLYFAARRQLLRGQGTLHGSAIGVSVRTMLKEVAELPDSWRKTRIVELLEQAESGPSGDHQDDGIGETDEETLAVPDASKSRLAMVLEARGLMDEFYLNQYGRIANLRMYLLTFVIFAVAIGAIVLHFADLLPLPVGSDGNELAMLHVDFYALVLAFGGLGATISGIRTVQLSTDSPRALGSILGLWLPLARLVMGAISALLLTLLLLAGFVTTTYVNLGVIYGLAFASGFSERLLLQAVRSFENAATRRAAT